MAEEEMGQEEIEAMIEADRQREESEKSARLFALEKKYPENIQTVARKIAQQRNADPDAPLSTRDGDFEWGWVAYAEQAKELIEVIG